MPRKSHRCRAARYYAAPIRFKRRSVHSHGLAVDQPSLRKSLQNPGEHSSMRFKVDQPTGSRNRRMIRWRLLQFQSQKRPHAQRVRRAPGNPPFRFDLFKVPQHQQSEIASRRQTRTSLGRCVEWRTLLFNVVVEPVLLQDPIQPCVKRMRGASRQILCGNPHRRMTIFSFPFTHGHARTLREHGQVSREKII